jgi:hypothetical protein
VGLAENRPWPAAGGPRNPSGNLAQGGTFESWFFLNPPEQPPTGGNPFFNNLRAALLGEPGAGVNVNAAGAEELMTLPGVTEDGAAAIVKARRKRFRDADDFVSRSGLDAAAAAKVLDFIVF